MVPKSPCQMAIAGDLNTSYFHKIANGRKRKNLVHSLDDNGVLVEGTDNLLELATTYYKNLFGPAPGNMFPISPSLWSDDEILSDVDNEELVKPFSIEEVKAALFSMETNRDPDSDNVPSEFYQHCLDVVKNDIMRLFEYFSS